MADYKIPFDEKGNQLADGSYPNAKIQWMENHEFSTIMKYVGYSKGRSAVTFYFEMPNGKSVNFYLSNFNDLIPHMKNGHVYGNFTFQKRGTAYSCKLLESFVK